MDKKLPNVFANAIDYEMKNTQEMFYSAKEAGTSEQKKSGDRSAYTISTKINRIFSSDDFVYKSRVEIETDNGVEEKTIIGKKNNHLITMDSELIDISKIKDIRKI